jgi:hypothetical protein
LRAVAGMPEASVVSLPHPLLYALTDSGSGSVRPNVVESDGCANPTYLLPCPTSPFPLTRSRSAVPARPFPLSHSHLSGWPRADLFGHRPQQLLRARRGAYRTQRTTTSCTTGSSRSSRPSRLRSCSSAGACPRNPTVRKHALAERPRVSGRMAMSRSMKSVRTAQGRALDPRAQPAARVVQYAHRRHR